MPFLDWTGTWHRTCINNKYMYSLVDLHSHPPPPQSMPCGPAQHAADLKEKITLNTPFDTISMHLWYFWSCIVFLLLFIVISVYITSSREWTNNRNALQYKSSAVNTDLLKLKRFVFCQTVRWFRFECMISWLADQVEKPEMLIKTKVINRKMHKKWGKTLFCWSFLSSI